MHVFSFVSTLCNSQLTSSNIVFFSNISFDLINRFICQHLAFDGVVHILVILRAIENLRKYLKDRTQVHRPTLFYKRFLCVFTSYWYFLACVHILQFGRGVHRFSIQGRKRAKNVVLIVQSTSVSMHQLSFDAVF